MMLTLDRVHAYHGKAQVLHGVTLTVAAGEIVSLTGRNGAGKTTLLRAMAGLMPVTAGRLELNGTNVTHLAAHRLSRRGVNDVPETRCIFPNLTVEENLLLATFAHAPSDWTLSRLYALFPRLQERARSPGDSLSRGEQQMLAIARGLLTGPKFLLLDEPTEGLAPLIVDDLVAAIRDVGREGVGVVLVEQKLTVPMALASRQYVIENGQIVWQGTTDQLRSAKAEVEALLGF